MEHRILKARKQLLWEPLRTVGKNRASCGPHCPWSNYMERSASNGSSRSSGEREKRGSGALAATESSAHEARRKRREVARRSWNKEDDFLPWPVRERRRGNEKDLPSIFPDEGQRKGKKNGDRDIGHASSSLWSRLDPCFCHATTVNGTDRNTCPLFVDMQGKFSERQCVK